MVRIKHRYLLVSLLYPDEDANPGVPSAKSLPDIVHFHKPSPDALTPQVLLRAIRDQVALLYGDYGAGVTASGLSIKYLSPATSTFIIRSPRAHVRLVWAALSFMTCLPKLSKHRAPPACVMKVIRVSGTIKKAEQEAIRRARADILRAKREDGGQAPGVVESQLRALLAEVEGDEGGCVEDTDMDAGGEEDDDSA